MTNDDTPNGITSFETTPLDGISRRTVLKTSAVGAGGLALGASANAAGAQAQAETEDEQDDEDEAEPVRIPQLNLETLEATIGDETLQAESAEESRPGSTTYVGEAAGRPGLFVAVSHVDEAPDQPDEEQPDVAVYLCNAEVGTESDLGLWLTGDFDETGMTLTIEEDQDVEVKVALVDGEFLGVARLPDEAETVPFVTSEATGVAGMYAAESEQAEDAGLRWIVLADGRQRGTVCCNWPLCFPPCPMW